MSFKDFVKKTSASEERIDKPVPTGTGIMSQIRKAQDRSETAKARYRRLTKESGFKTGDVVRVVAKAATNQFGWGNSWEPAHMDPAVGNEYTISRGDEGQGYYLAETYCSFPFFVLEMVKPAEEEKQGKQVEGLMKLADIDELMKMFTDSAVYGTKKAEPEPEEDDVVRQMREEFGSKTQL